jgi:hypothetical protein
MSEHGVGLVWINEYYPASVRLQPFERGFVDMETTASKRACRIVKLILVPKTERETKERPHLSCVWRPGDQINHFIPVSGSEDQRLLTIGLGNEKPSIKAGGRCRNQLRFQSLGRDSVIQKPSNLRFGGQTPCAMLRAERVDVIFRIANDA